MRDDSENEISSRGKESTVLLNPERDLFGVIDGLIHTYVYAHVRIIIILICAGVLTNVVKTVRTKSARW